MSDFGVYYRGGEKFRHKVVNVATALLEPGLWAVLFYRAAHSMYRARVPVMPSVLTRLNKFFTQVDISHESEIGKRLRLPHCLGIVIGSTCVIGDDVEILNGVTLGSVHLRCNGKRHPTIGDRVFIGAGAKVLGNIIIGKNSKIGANAVVLSSIPENSTAVGIPARII